MFNNSKNIYLFWSYDQNAHQVNLFKKVNSLSIKHLDYNFYLINNQFNEGSKKNKINEVQRRVWFMYQTMMWVNLKSSIESTRSTFLKPHNCQSVAVKSTTMWSDFVFSASWWKLELINLKNTSIVLENFKLIFLKRTSIEHLFLDESTIN